MWYTIVAVSYSVIQKKTTKQFAFSFADAVLLILIESRSLEFDDCGLFDCNLFVELYLHSIAGLLRDSSEVDSASKTSENNLASAECAENRINKF